MEYTMIDRVTGDGQFTACQVALDEYLDSIEDGWMLHCEGDSEEIAKHDSYHDWCEQQLNAFPAWTIQQVLGFKEKEEAFWAELDRLQDIAES